MASFCLVGNKIDIIPWFPSAIRKRTARIETTAHFNKKRGHMSIDYR